nr:MAG TPA: hypothetical protein [Caudoviricetes sp.]
MFYDFSFRNPSLFFLREISSEVFEFIGVVRLFFTPFCDRIEDKF